MTLKTSQLRDAIVFALCVSASSVAFAQDAAPAPQNPVPTEAPAAQSSEEATTLDRVEVTGSRISIPGLTTNSPVTTVDRAELDRAQPVSVEDVMKLQPSAVPAMGPGMNNGNAGAATLNLRGLGSNRTLVLLDGRRVVPFDLNGVVDTNVIPLALLQSVDIVTGGASAVYGADAISGVANFILRRNFEGLEVSGFYGQTSKGDGAKWRSDVTFGASLDDGRGNVAVSLGRSVTDPVMQGDRPWGLVSRSSASGAAQGSGTAVPTNIFGEFDVAGTVNPTTGLIGGSLASYNFNPLNYYQVGGDRYQATALAHYEITDKAEAYSQLLYTKSDVNTQLAESGTFFNTYSVNIGNPYIPEAARQQLCADRQALIDEMNSTGAPNPPPAIQNCSLNSLETVDLTLGRRFTEMGPRLNDFYNKTYQFTLGLRGDLNDHWRYDTYWTHGESDQLQTRGNWGSNNKVAQSLIATDLDGNGVPECVDGSLNCVPLNVFGPEGSITPDQINFINQGAILTQGVRQNVFSALVSGDLGDNFKSPWSDYPIGLVFGVEHRAAEAFNASDSASQAGDVLGTGGASPDLLGTFLMNEAYTEFMVPIVSNAPGAYALTLEAGYRRSSFEVGAQDATKYGSWKYGLEWAPIESLRFRGMAQRATRAPNINELFYPPNTILDNRGTDPCADDSLNPANNTVAGTLENLCVLTGVPGFRIGGDPNTTDDEGLQQPSAGQINAFYGGNIGLKPEIADTQTLGLVWTPMLGGNEFALTLDYWKIELEGMISTFTADDVIDGCYSATLNPTRTVNAFCNMTGRSPVTGQWNGPTSVGVNQILNNLGRLKTDGYDIGVRYGFGMADWGRLDLALDATIVRSNDDQSTPVSVVNECAGHYSVACDTLTPKVKWNQRTTWSMGDYEVGLNWRHLSSMEAQPGTGPWFPAYREIDAYNYFDLSFAAKLPWNARVTLSINNLTDKEPPFVGNTIGSTSQNSGNTFPQVYDALGRYYTLGMNWKF